MKNLKYFILSAYLLSPNDTLTLFDLLASNLPSLLDISLLDKTGVSLPCSSTNTTPNWYSLSDFIDLAVFGPTSSLVKLKSILGIKEIMYILKVSNMISKAINEIIVTIVILNNPISFF